MKTRTWILLFAALLAVLFGVRLLLPRGEKRAVIRQDGKVLYTADLSKDASYTVTGAAGENRITVKDGEIFVESADCPDQICVRHGALKHGGEPIVCLPNRLVITWQTEETDADGVSGRIG